MGFSALAACFGFHKGPLNLQTRENLIVVGLQTIVCDCGEMHAASGGHVPTVEDSHLARLFANGTAENKAKVMAAAAAAVASEHAHPLLANAQVCITRLHAVPQWEGQRLWSECFAQSLWCL